MNASPAILDFAILLAPLPGDPPTGGDLRRDDSADNLFPAMKDARTTARRMESQAVWDDGAGGERPNWRAVVDSGRKILAEKSKDLQVAAWLTEALVRERGFAGLRDGFRLCRELVERYWDGLHPRPDPDDNGEMPLKVAVLAGLNGEDAEGTLIAPILGVSLVESKEFGALGTSAFDHAASLEQITDLLEREKRIRHGAPSSETIQKAIAQTPLGFFQTLLADLTEAQREFGALCAILEKNCGAADAPSSANIRRALEACRVRLTALMPAPPAPDPATVQTPANPGGNGAVLRPAGPIRSREEAFELIRQVAVYFRQTEPHSILAWQLEECIRWGKMSLPDLLTDLIADGSTREALFRRVGIPLPSQG